MDREEDLSLTSVISSSYLPIVFSLGFMNNFRKSLIPDIIIVTNVVKTS